MSTVFERRVVNCSVNQGAVLLRDYFRAHGNADGDVARITLRASAPMPGSSADMQFERTAIATLAPIHKSGEMLPHYAISWSPEAAGPYPTFHGDLAIENAEDYHTFYLVLRGTYEPPLGAVGAAFDAVLGYRIAQSSVRNLLATIGEEIEAHFSTVESTKASKRVKADNIPQ